jgi:hypothetical protein
VLPLDYSILLAQDNATWIIDAVKRGAQIKDLNAIGKHHVSQRDLRGAQVWFMARRT